MKQTLTTSPLSILTTNLLQDVQTCHNFLQVKKSVGWEVAFRYGALSWRVVGLPVDVFMLKCTRLWLMRLGCSVMKTAELEVLGSTSAYNQLWPGGIQSSKSLADQPMDVQPRDMEKVSFALSLASDIMEFAPGPVTISFLEMVYSLCSMYASGAAKLSSLSETSGARSSFMNHGFLYKQKKSTNAAVVSSAVIMSVYTTFIKILDDINAFLQDGIMADDMQQEQDSSSSSVGHDVVFSDDICTSVLPSHEFIRPAHMSLLDALASSMVEAGLSLCEYAGYLQSTSNQMGITSSSDTSPTLLDSGLASGRFGTGGKASLILGLAGRYVSRVVDIAVLISSFGNVNGPRSGAVRENSKEDQQLQSRAKVRVSESKILICINLSQAG